MKHLAILLAIAFIAIGCSTETPEQQAQQLTMTDLTMTPGYAWFPAEMATYSPNPVMVESIKQNFTPNHKICIFVKPSCSCRGTQRLFPRIMKALQDANIDMARVEVWSMRSTSDKHKYMPMLNVMSLPTIFVMRDGLVRTTILDADFNDSNSDSLLVEALKK